MISELLTKPIARPKLADERFTYNEFCARVHEEKADLINGEIVMASPARFVHENCFGLLLIVLRLFTNKKKMGVIVGSRFGMKLSEYDAPEPDIMFVRKDRLHLLGDTEIFGPADLVVEIISPGSRKLDTVDKKNLYALHGIKEYWLIDLYQQEAFFWKNVAGIWQDLPVDEKGVFRSEVIPGFWLRVDWLFAAEPLDEAAIFETILAGDPETK